MLSTSLLFSVITTVVFCQYQSYYQQNTPSYYPYSQTANYGYGSNYNSYNSFPSSYAGYYFGAYNRQNPFFYTQNYYPSNYQNNYPNYNYEAQPLPGGWQKLPNGDIMIGNKLAAFYLICEGRSCQG